MLSVERDRAGGSAGAPGEAPSRRRRGRSARTEPGRPLPWPAASGKERSQRAGEGRGRDGRQEIEDPERAARAGPASAKTRERERVNRAELLQHSREERGSALGRSSGSSEPRHPAGHPFPSRHGKGGKERLTHGAL